jgi:GntR family transcriptional regulator of vanillate catabolism
MPRGATSSQVTRATLGLRELIFDGELPPGERVPEVGLAERLAVSRTPLRLALSTLAHEGLVDPLRGGGFVVRSFTRADVADARFAAERLRSPEQLAALTAATEQLDAVVADRSPESLVAYAELNDAYHEALVQLACSETLRRAVANAVALPFAAPGALLTSQATLAGSREILVVAQHQHRVLLEAIRAGHGTRAEEVAREHARMALLNLEVVLEDHGALASIPGAPLLRAAM